MKILLNILVILGFGIALFLVAQLLTIPDEVPYNSAEQYVYDKGNASPEIRREVLDQLHLLNEGYEARDTSKLDEFMEKLFSRDNVLILGTMPAEIYSGFEEAADLVSSDWLYWGDVEFHMEKANISASDSVVWVSTIGQVEFDMSRLLVLPLRFTGVMVNEDQNWKFQQAQFQFDLKMTWVLGLIFFLSLMLLVTIVRLVIVIIIRGRNQVERS